MKNASPPRPRLGLAAAAADAALALAAVLLAAWAYSGGGAAPRGAPLSVAAKSNATVDATVRIDRDNVVHWNDQALAGAGSLDAELRAAKPRGVRVVASDECLHAAVRQVLESLARQDVAVARLEAAP
jgi:hypothetical protein